MLIDDLRKGKRVVHPRLQPPPGYATDYEWNMRQKTAVYVGLTARPAGARPPKRKREDSPTSDFQSGRDGHPSSASNLRGGHLDPFGDNASKRRRRVSSKPKKRVVLGARTSSRNPTAIFDRLDALVGLGDSDSDLTDLESDSDGDSDSNGQNSESDLSELTPSESEDEPGPSRDTMETDMKPDEDPDVVSATPEEQAADERVSQRAGEPVRASLVDAGDDSDLTVLPSSDGEDEIDRQPALTAAQIPKLEDEPATVNETDLAIDRASAELDDSDRDADDEAEDEDEKPVSMSFEPGRSPSLDFDIAPRRLASAVMPAGLIAAPLVFATPTPVAPEVEVAVPDASESAPPTLASVVEPVLPTEVPTPSTITTSQPPNPDDDFDFDPDDGDLVDDIVLIGDPRAVPRTSTSHSPAELSSELVDAPAEDRAGSGDTSNTPPDASPNGQDGESREAGGQATEGAGDAGPPPPTASAGGQGGDDGDGKDHRKAADPVLEVESEVEPESEPPVEAVVEEDAPAAHSGAQPAVEFKPTVEAAVAPSDSGENGDLDDGENEEAALLLLMLNPGPSPASSKAPPADSANVSRPQDAPLGYGPAPDSHAPSPPKTSSASETSTGSSRSLEQGLVLVPQKRCRAARAVPDAPDVKPEVLRSTRRNSLLSPSPPAPAPLSRSTSAQAAKKLKTETGPMCVPCRELGWP